MKIVFSDLDGTILDHFTYSYTKSMEGIDLLKKNNIPLILVSSKTFYEIEQLHKELGLRDPFIFEGGGGIAYSDMSSYKTEILGFDIDTLKLKLNILKDTANISIKTIFEMDDKELIDLTSLSKKSLPYVRKRLTSIPFLFENTVKYNIDLSKLNGEIKKHGLAVTKGGRFYHLGSSATDKGSAVTKIAAYMKVAYKADNILCAGLGDSENDIPMLEAVDKAFIIRKHDNTFLTSPANAVVTKANGPEGFTEAVKAFVLI